MKGDSRIVGGANLLQVFAPSHPSNKTGQKNTAGKKEKIVGASRKSRYNFAKTLSMVDWPINPAHVCLTYGDQWPDDPKEDLPAIVEYLRYRKWFGFWRLEFQGRGLWHSKGKRSFCDGKQKTFESAAEARSFSDDENVGRIPIYVPHFHLLICGSIENHEEAFARWWAKRTGNPSEYALNITYNEAGRSAWYLAMHSQKPNQSPDIAVGRWWGWVNRPTVQKYMTREERGTLSQKQEIRLCRIARKLSGGKHRPFAGRTFSLFCSDWNQKKVLLLESLELQQKQVPQD